MIVVDIDDRRNAALGVVRELDPLGETGHVIAKVDRGGVVAGIAMGHQLRTPIAVDVGNGLDRPEILLRQVVSKSPRAVPIPGDDRQSAEPRHHEFDSGLREPVAGQDVIGVERERLARTHVVGEPIPAVKDAQAGIPVVPGPGNQFGLSIVVQVHREEPLQPPLEGYLPQRRDQASHGDIDNIDQRTVLVPVAVIPITIQQLVPPVAIKVDESAGKSPPDSEECRGPGGELPGAVVLEDDALQVAIAERAKDVEVAVLIEIGGLDVIRSVRQEGKGHQSDVAERSVRPAVEPSVSVQVDQEGLGSGERHIQGGRHREALDIRLRQQPE
ncbi:MAG: hypothetical protein FD129_2378 [bacterium]|nr:MAG: hypothetical protein FD129_2378 [bacterium]